MEDATPRTTYIDYLKSPIIGLLVGQGDEQALLTAHQALLVTSPWFADACAKFSENVSQRRIELLKKTSTPSAASSSSSILATTSPQAPRFPRSRARPLFPSCRRDRRSTPQHACVYTLGETLHLPQLQSLASSKIHCVNSTAKGEIAYARYVYAHTKTDDKTIRAPVANFWATRSHTLRAEAEEEFRQMCLKFPQFGYNVLTRVLDEKLRREGTEKLHPTPSSSRKRPRGI